MATRTPYFSIQDYLSLNKAVGDMHFSARNARFLLSSDRRKVEGIGRRAGETNEVLK